MCTNVKEIISHCHSLTIWNIREYSRCWSLFTWDGTGISTQQIFLMALYLSSLEVGQMTTIHCTFGAKKWNLHLGLRTNLQLSHCNTCRFTNKYSPPYSEAKSISEKIPAGKVGLLNLLYRSWIDYLTVTGQEVLYILMDWCCPSDSWTRYPHGHHGAHNRLACYTESPSVYNTAASSWWILMLCQHPSSQRSLSNSWDPLLWGLCYE